MELTIEQISNYIASIKDFDLKEMNVKLIKEDGSTIEIYPKKEKEKKKQEEIILVL